MLEISIDPGVCRCGITLWRDGLPMASSCVRFIEGFENMKKFQAKYGAQRHLALTRAVHKFCETDLDWAYFFQKADLLILETTSLSTIKPVFYGFVSWWTKNKLVEPLAFVDPRQVSKWAKFSPITKNFTRLHRKKAIEKRVRERFPDLSNVSQDELDSIFNWMFYSDRRKKTTKPWPELSWSSSFSRIPPPPKIISPSKLF